MDAALGQAQLPVSLLRQLPHQSRHVLVVVYLAARQANPQCSRFLALKGYLSIMLKSLEMEALEEMHRVSEFCCNGLSEK